MDKFIILLFLLCALTVSANEKGKAKDALFDFDHKVHYKQKSIAQGQYFIEVLAQSKTHFEQLSTFLLRHSYNLCGSYEFTLQVLNGIEQFDDRRVSPNYIQPSLSANLVCAKK